MKLKAIFIFTLCSIFLIGCTNKICFEGVYSRKGDLASIDSLTIENNGEFEQRIYFPNGKLKTINHGIWKRNGKGITFHGLIDFIDFTYDPQKHDKGAQKGVAILSTRRSLETCYIDIDRDNEEFYMN